MFTINMKKNLGISISVGLLSGIWFLIADMLGVPAWPGFIGWSIFFYTGADVKACRLSLPCIVLGPILAYLTAYTQTALGTSGITSAIVVAGLGFAMTIAQSFSIFQVAAATFIGANVYFASGSLFHSIVITPIGLILGIVSVKFGTFLESFILKKEATKKVA
jgi:hypothetical protein